MNGLERAWLDVVAGLITAIVAVVITGGAILDNPYFRAAIWFAAFVVLLLTLGEKRIQLHR